MGGTGEFQTERRVASGAATGSASWPVLAGTGIGEYLVAGSCVGTVGA